jgi:hypothetical protein
MAPKTAFASGEKLFETKFIKMPHIGHLWVDSPETRHEAASRGSLGGHDKANSGQGSIASFAVGSSPAPLQFLSALKLPGLPGSDLTLQKPILLDLDAMRAIRPKTPRVPRYDATQDLTPR